jgi:FKBP-type peptidyl-prolyl cis-trans isomerase
VAGDAVGRSGPGHATPGPGGVIGSNAIVIFDVELVNMKG